MFGATDASKLKQESFRNHQQWNVDAFCATISTRHCANCPAAEATTVFFLSSVAQLEN